VASPTTSRGARGTPTPAPSRRAADRPQTSINLAVGSALAGIGLTIPVVAVAAVVFGIPVVLGLSPKDPVLPALSFAVSTLTLGTGRTTPMQVAVHSSPSPPSSSWRSSRSAPDVIRIVQGLPDPELIAMADQGNVAHGGCGITGDDPEGKCRSCGAEFRLERPGRRR
jgi:hypothetical protein